MPLIIDPNIIYLILLVGLWLGVTAAYTPGTGVLEAASIGVTLFSIWQLSLLPVNWWALIVLILGVVGFLVMPFINRRLLLLAMVGLVLQALGSFFLLDKTPVSPLVIGVTILVALVYHQFALRPALERARALPVNDENEGLLGARGRVLTPLTPLGTVHVRGESWSARSERPADKGDDVIVVERDGLILTVEPVKYKRDESQPEEA
jgi:membrane-bound serine protease (ClpP class)